MTKIFSSIQLGRLYELASQQGLSTKDLIERSAIGFSNLFGQYYPQVERVHIFAGPDLNGAIALAVARLLSERGYLVSVYLFYQKGRLAECTDAERLQAEQAQIEIIEVVNQFTPPQISSDSVIIDGLYGYELVQRLEGGFAKLVGWINSLGREVISIDLPSGLFAEDNSLNDGSTIIKAKRTVTFETPRLVMFLSDYAEQIGQWHVLPLGIDEQTANMLQTQHYLLSERMLSRIMLSRKPFQSETDYGGVLLIGGASGRYGQLTLAVKAALHSGCAKVHVSTDEKAHPTLNIAVPEATTLQANIIPNHRNYQAIALGLAGAEGLTTDSLRNIFSSYRGSIVMDDEAIRLLSEERALLEIIPHHSVLILGVENRSLILGLQASDLDYINAAISFASQHKLTIVLRGSYTTVVRSSEQVYFTTTGNAGMLKEGINAVQTGLVAGLIARGYDSVTATMIGTYLWGLSADLYAGRYSVETMTATELLSMLPSAMKQLEG